MKIICIGTYPPRKCGIATFTYNLINSITNNTNKSASVNIVAINDLGQDYSYPKEVKYTIAQNEQSSYINAASFINNSNADICILEHEFGIFGGDSGIYILSLIKRLRIPFIVTFHSVLKNPSFTQKAIINEICKRANKVIVMSHKATNFLSQIYGLPNEKLKIIEHGVPEFTYNHQECKNKFNIGEKTLLMTFGLLSKNKGIETVIKALPEIIKTHPNIHYLILGKTHPNILKYFGEEYRNYLQKLIKSLNLNDFVSFHNSFVDEDLLCQYLRATDIYITPYLDEAQITSGTLAYAVGAGAAVISTPYWHAEELLANNRGRLFDFNDYLQLASIVNDLMDNPKGMERLRSNASAYGKKTTWKLIGQEYINVCQEIITSSPRTITQPSFFDPKTIPAFSLDHIQTITDQTGILQHALYGIPNFKEGYCLDDNARALLMSLMAYKFQGSKQALSLIPIYLSYVAYMQKGDGAFYNFLTYKREFDSAPTSEDCFGRTMWALGYLIRFAPKDAYLYAGKDIFSKALPHVKGLRSLRGNANTTIGLCYYLKMFPNDEQVLEVLRKTTDRLIKRFERGSEESWEWFETKLSYDNGILPLALFHAYEFIRSKSILSIAIRSLNFLDKISFRNGYLSPVGSNGWYPKDKVCAQYAQQSIDAMAMVLVYNQAYRVTKNTNFIKRIFDSFNWFLGNNDIGISLYDNETKGCCDGLEKDKINRNQGAESTIGYLISNLIASKNYNNYHVILQNYQTAVLSLKPQEIQKQKLLHNPQ